jgi:hypothetical protein
MQTMFIFLLYESMFFSINFSRSDCYLFKVFGGHVIGFTFETSKVTTTYTNTFLSREHIPYTQKHKQWAIWSRCIRM